jgi:hypothetical protein
MEHIKVLEEFLETEKKYIKDKKYHKEYNISKEAIQRAKEWAEAIEYLLQENKASKETINILTNKLEKLIEENNELKEGCKTCVIRNDLNDYVENSIPISVIQNKIDELEPQVHLLQPNAKPCELMREFKVEGALNVLQELLEERNK